MIGNVLARTIQIDYGYSLLGEFKYALAYTKQLITVLFFRAFFAINQSVQSCIVLLSRLKSA